MTTEEIAAQKKIDDAVQATVAVPPKAKPDAPAEMEVDLEAMIAKALEGERAKVAAEAVEKDRLRDEEAARKAGEFEKLYEAEKSQRAKDLAELRSVRAVNALTAYLAENNPDYLKSAKYITPLLGTVGDDEKVLAGAIKTAVATFVADNPRTAPPEGTLPPTTRNKSEVGGFSERFRTDGRTPPVLTGAANMI